MPTVEVDGLLGPVDREVDLADLFQRLGSVLEPGGDPTVAGMSPNDRIDVAIEDSEPLLVPPQHEPGVRVGGCPPFHARRQRNQLRRLLLEPFPIARQALYAEGRRVGDRIELEVVDDAVELERDHPVDKLRRRSASSRRKLRVEREEPSTRIADDAAEVVSPRDDLDGARQRDVGHGVQLGGVGYRRTGLQDVDRLVHPATMCVGRTPTMEVGTGTDQREDRTRECAHHCSPFSRYLLSWSMTASLWSYDAQPSC